MLNKEKNRIFYNEIAPQRYKWRKKNIIYYKYLNYYYSFLIPPGSRVLEIGSGTGELLNAVNPSYGVGIDYSENMVEIAKSKFPHLNFFVQDAEKMDLNSEFDYIILSDLIGSLWDVQKVFKNIRKISNPKTKIIISYYNYLWEPILKLGELFHYKMKQPLQNWLSPNDLMNLLDLENFECIKAEKKILFPFYIPIISTFLNRIVGNLPILNGLCLTNFFIVKPREEIKEDYTVSIVIPARNEKGNIENAIKRIPDFGKSIEIIFVEGNSSDSTYDEMIRVKKIYKEKNIKVLKQTGTGKGNAVREGFNLASGDILMILDADLTVSPEDLPKFYEALSKNRGDFINGSRLVYQMDNQAMRFLNILGNKFFSLFFTFLLGQKLKDTLCGTKVLFKEDYDKIQKNRKYFGDFDPFGDFDLLFGAAKLNLKILEVPVRYKERQYGSTQIQRFKHGQLLIKMSLFAAKKIKFI